MRQAIKKRKSIAVFFQAHEITPQVDARFQRIKDDVSGFADCYLSVQADFGEDCKTEHSEHLKRFYQSTLSEQLGYPYLNDDKIVPGCGHYPLMLFSRTHKYKYYWFVEYDVEFTGNWSTILGLPLTERYHFATAHVRKYSTDPKWTWWKSLHFPFLNTIEPNTKRRLKASFNPIFCVSRKALRWMDFCHKLGCRGHNEALLINLVRMRLWKIINLNERGYVSGSGIDPWIPPEDLSTLRWRPPISKEELAQQLPNTIYHPIKDEPA